MDSQIIMFLRGTGFDYKLRKINQIRSVSDFRLENMHDIIQWMFPTDIPSIYSDFSPVLTKDDINIIIKDKNIQDNIELSLNRMIRFYENSDYWITHKNHNFLRLTRILRCLWLAGRVHDYVSLSRALDDLYIDYHEIIGQETFLFWKNANDYDYLTKHHIPTNPYKSENTQSYIEYL